jgi:uronate dehydrogenase
VYGVSNNPDPFFDNSNAHRLGYQPQDDALDHLADPTIRGQRPDLNTVEGATVGGPFAALGYVGTPERLLAKRREEDA